MTSCKQAKQVRNLPFMNNKGKIHIHTNKFVETTINTYNKKNQILASKHT